MGESDSKKKQIPKDGSALRCDQIYKKSKYGYVLKTNLVKKPSRTYWFQPKKGNEHHTALYTHTPVTHSPARRMLNLMSAETVEVS